MFWKVGNRWLQAFGITARARCKGSYYTGQHNQNECGHLVLQGRVELTILLLKWPKIRNILMTQPLWCGCYWRLQVKDYQGLLLPLLLLLLLLILLVVLLLLLQLLQLLLLVLLLPQLLLLLLLLLLLSTFALFIAHYNWMRLSRNVPNAKFTHVRIHLRHPYLVFCINIYWKQLWSVQTYMYGSYQVIVH